MDLNFKHKELFKLRFKREPKVWSLEDVHALWLRLEDRFQKRKKIVSDIYDKIIDEIPKTDGKKIVYFFKNEKIYQMTFRWHSEFKSYGHSTDRLEFSNNKSIARDEKIDFILANNRAFELGQEYSDALKKHKLFFHGRVKQILVEMVQDKLRDFYKDKFPPDITIVKIGDKSYYFSVDNQYRYSYQKFHFSGEVVNNVVEL